MNEAGSFLSYSGAQLLQIAMPMGGIGAGCISLNGYGGLQDFSLRHRPATTARADGHVLTEAAFGLLHIRGDNSATKLLEGPLPVEKIYDQGLKAQGFRQGGHEGLPRFENVEFQNQFPFGHINLSDGAIPLHVRITGWNPFIPLDDINSGLPCAILEYHFENVSERSVDFDFSYHLSHLASAQNLEVSTHVLDAEEGEFGGGVLFANGASPHAENFGTAALFSPSAHPQIKASWFRGGWFDAISTLWHEVSTGTFRQNSGQKENRMLERSGGSVLHTASLEAGESITFPLIIAWHFPNSNQRYGELSNENCGCESSTDAPACDAPACDAPACDAPAWRPFYAGQWREAGEVAKYVAKNLASLRQRTRNFASALWSSTLPLKVLDAVASNLAILKSPTVLRQENGNVWAWEGCFVDAGCCHGSCTHVWNYAQALPHLFPQLERTLRAQELARSKDERGHINFRSALPDGEVPHDWHAAADGQLGGILKLWRDYHISGDREWLLSFYPLAKTSLDYCIQRWDPEHKGALFEPHHNTYDIEFWGPDGMCGTIYVAALSAFADLARELGRMSEIAPYQALAERGARFLDEELFNGEYYFQKVQWEGLHDTSFATRLAQDDDGDDDALELERIQGPKYQYGDGCLSDGVIGAWMAQLYGLKTPLNSDNVRSTLRSIFQYNFKNDLFDHICTQRPGYALGHEAGLVLCTWPRGDKPILPFVYSDEVWTGIEYQVASHLIAEGFVEEGLTIVRSARARYNGHTRNPFNEYECGSFYARALSSYALLQSLSGFRYDAVTQTLHFGPKIRHEDFQVFFSTSSAFGTILWKNDEIALQVLAGQLVLQKLEFARGEHIQILPWSTTISEGQRQQLKLA